MARHVSVEMSASSHEGAARTLASNPQATRVLVSPGEHAVARTSAAAASDATEKSCFMETPEVAIRLL